MLLVVDKVVPAFMPSPRHAHRRAEEVALVRREVELHSALSDGQSGGRKLLSSSQVVGPLPQSTFTCAT